MKLISELPGRKASHKGPVYTIPFSFHIGLGKAILCEHFSCIHDAVFISYRISFMPLTERFHLKTRKRYAAYRISAFSCKQAANRIWNENGIVETEGQSDMKPIRYEMKTV